MHSRAVVVDDFYAEPDAVRAFALRSDFGSAGRYNYPGWQSVKALHAGTLQTAFERLLSRPIEVDAERYTWGGFRIITEATGRLAKVHADQAVDWAGLVYLTPDAPMSAGTGFFRHRATGLEGPPSDLEARRLGYEDADDFELNVARRDMADLGAWELIGEVGPVYNRLVLFRGAELYHAPLGGCGATPATARMTHNFFFNEAPVSPLVARRLAGTRS